MRVVVIGGSGHIGTYLVPQLVEAGHTVINVSRGQREPYHIHPAWQVVQQVAVDRAVEESMGVFGPRIRDLQADAVIDLICFTLDSARHLVEALRGQVQHYVCCSTLWVYGYRVEVPVTEAAHRRPFGYFGEYSHQKAKIEAYLLDEARRHGFPATVLHCGHIVGPGWEPLNPLGNFNPQVFSTLAQGKELMMPHLGMETLHHVHASDVAQAFVQALTYWNHAVSESFNIASPAAVTLRGYAETAAAWFGQTANLRFVPWDTFRATVTEEDAAVTWDHLAHTPNWSIAKAQRLLDYCPRYRSLPAIEEAVRWLVTQGSVVA
jgi:nucleoside-diphosphate-sugar epimerase